MHLIDAGDVLNSSRIGWKTEKSSSTLTEKAIGHYATNYNEFNVGAY
jgi:hypothetical protein